MAGGRARDGREARGRCRHGPPVGAVVAYANASIGGQAQTRFRFPNAWSIRRTGGQYLRAA